MVQTEPPTVLAIGAHPDDIEFMMAGTLLLLADRGWQIHYVTLANGSCGTMTDSVEEITARRREEARNACGMLNGVFHESLCNDLEIYHTTEIVAQTVALVREARPQILLTTSPQDYMEDHINTQRVAVTAAFARGMRNYPCNPGKQPVTDNVTIYHALPYGLRGPLREKIYAGQYVDISEVMARKKEMLRCHKSQKEWLDQSQGVDSYIQTMVDFSSEVGAMSEKFSCSEGWRRHSHLGFCDENDDPLLDALGDKCIINREYENNLG